MAKKYGTTMLSGSEKEKRTPKFLRSIFESPKKKAERLSTASGKANTAASKKMYAAESMFKASIKDPRKALDAETRKSYKKRIDYMEKRKAAGKNYSKKNLADLKAKLK